MSFVVKAFSTTFRTILLAVGTAVVAATLAGACGSTDEDSLVAPGIPTPTPTASPPTPTPLPTATPGPESGLGAPSSGYDRVILAPYEPPEPQEAPGELVDDQVLRLLTRLNPETTAPYIEQTVLRGLSPWLFMPLFLYTPDAGNDHTEPELRQGVSISYDLSSDGLTYIFHLHPRAQFTDGLPVTAGEIKATWEYVATAPDLPPDSGALRFLEYIAGVRELAAGEATEAYGIVPLDDRTLQVTLEEPLSTWPLLVAHPTLGLFKAQAAERNPDTWQIRPTGVGPYVLEHLPDVETGVTRKLTPSRRLWWNRGQPAPEVEVMLVADLETQAILYENGQVDVAVAEGELRSAAADPESVFFRDLQTHGSAGLSYLAFTSDHPPFDEWEVRGAFSHAVDMRTIVTGVYGVTDVWAESLVVGGVPCHQPGIGHEYSPEKARELLAQSSYSSGGNLPPISFEVSRPQEARLAELAVEQWRESLNVEVTIRRVAAGDAGREVVEIRRASIESPIFDPELQLTEMALSSSAKTEATTRHSNEKLDGLVERANRLELDDPERCAAYNAVENEILDNYYMVPGVRATSQTWLRQPWVLDWTNTWDVTLASLPYLRIGVRDRSLYE